MSQRPAPSNTSTLPPAQGAGRLWHRRQALWGAGGVVLAALSACSKGTDDAPAPGNAAPPAAPATPAVPSADEARRAFEAAAGGTGFVVGQGMAVREVRVYFDPQCPHCAALWAAAKPLHDRIRMVWMPVAFINPNSAPQGAMLLGAKDAGAMMDEHERLLAAGQGGLAVNGAADEALVAMIKATTALWQATQAQSVPHMIYRVAAEGPYGMQSGGLPTAQLAQLLQL